MPWARVTGGGKSRHPLEKSHIFNRRSRDLPFVPLGTPLPGPEATREPYETAGASADLVWRGHGRAEEGHRAGEWEMWGTWLPFKCCSGEYVCSR